MTFNEWFNENLKDSAEDISNHGADAGYQYITMTQECVELYERFESDIWEMLREDAESFGHENPMALVATFGRQDMLEDPDQLKNLLVWYACERRARELVEA